MTDRGRDALGYAQSICRMTEDMISTAEERHNIQGIIRIALADSLCSKVITDSFDVFHGEYPDISLKVIPAGTDEMFRLVDHNEADIMCMMDSRINNTTYIIAHEERIGVSFVAASDSEIAKKKNVSVDEIIKMPFILTEKGMSYRRLMDEEFAKLRMEVSPILEIGRADLINELVTDGVGISFLPDYVTEEAVKEGRLTRLHVDGFSVELWKQIMYHRDKWLSPPMQATVSYLSGVPVDRK